MLSSRWSRVGELGRATLLISASTAVARVIGLVAALAGAALLGPNELGGYAFMLASAGLIGSFGAMGFAPLTTRSIAAAGVGEDAGAVASFVIRASFGLLVLAAVAFGGMTDPTIGFLHIEGATTRTAITITGAWSLFMGINPILSAVLAGHRLFAVVGQLIAVRALLVGAGSILGAVIESSALGCALGATVGEGLAALLSLTVIRSRGHMVGTAAGGWAAGGRNLLRGAAAAGAASVLIQFAFWASQAILLGTDNGRADNGGFSLASRILLIVTFVPNAYAMASLPHLARLDTRVRVAQSRKVLLQSVAFAAAIAAALGILGYAFIHRVDPGYAPYASTAALMAVVGVAISANNILGSMAVASQRLLAWIISDILLALGVMLGALLFVPGHGATGLALAHLLGYAVSAVWLVPVVFGGKKTVSTAGVTVE